VRKIGHLLVQAFFLPLTKVGRYFEDSIRRRQGIQFGQTAENVDGQLAATRPVFKNFATIDLREHFSALARDDASEDGGAVMKSPASPNFVVPAA
jgi:hypothetical protein